MGPGWAGLGGVGAGLGGAGPGLFFGTFFFGPFYFLFLELFLFESHISTLKIKKDGVRVRHA